jgi:hypothetical protein
LTMVYRSTDRLCRRGAPVQNLAHSASLHSGEIMHHQSPGSNTTAISEFDGRPQARRPGAAPPYRGRSFSQTRLTISLTQISSRKSRGPRRPKPDPASPRNGPDSLRR